MDIYVGNLSYGTDAQLIEDAFSQFGEVTKVHIVYDRETGRSKGFAFVGFADDDAALAAIEQMNGHELDGRPLKVNEARPREDKPPRRDFGGGGGGRGGFERRGGGGGGYGGNRGGGGRGGYGDNQGGGERRGGYRDPAQQNFEDSGGEGQGGGGFKKKSFGGGGGSRPGTRDRRPRF